MTDECIFCQIVDGKVPSYTVYEDEHIKAILDVTPAAVGHILVLTKEHFAIMPQIPDEVLGHLGKVTKDLSRALIRGLKAEGTTTFIANGIAGGQRAQHFMINIIPRNDGDGIALDIPRHDMSEEDHAKVVRILAPVIETVMSYKVPLPKEVVEEEEPDESLDSLTDFLTKDE